MDLQPFRLDERCLILTEKGIADIAFCPVRLKEEAGNPKRIKEDRRYPDETITLIRECLLTGEPNKKVTPKTLPNGRMVEPYEGLIWLVISTKTTDLLLTIDSVKATKDPNNSWLITVTRKKEWKPTDEDTLKSERMIRRVIARAFKEVFTNQVVLVETRYKGEEKNFVSQNPTEEHLKEADNFFESLRDIAEGDKPLVANTEKCSSCWWKECPYRLEIKGPSTGKPRRQLFQ